MQDDELKALVDRLKSHDSGITNSAIDHEMDCRKAATALETLARDNAELRKDAETARQMGRYLIAATEAERDQASAEVERLREFERRVTVEGMETANRYWEARYRDEAAQLTATQARLEEAVGIIQGFQDFRNNGHNFVYPAGSLQQIEAFLAKQENKDAT